MSDETIDILRLSPVLVLRVMNSGGIVNWLEESLFYIVTLASLIGASLFQTAIIPYETTRESRERLLSVSVTRNSVY